MDRLLDTFDEWARTHPRDADVGPPERFEPTRVPASSRFGLDLRSGAIRSIIWATASVRTTAGSTSPWSIARATCVTTAGSSLAPGLYAIGLPVLRRRKSTFIHGAEDDAREVIEHLAGYLAKNDAASPGVDPPHQGRGPATGPSIAALGRCGDGLRPAWTRAYGECSFVRRSRHYAWTFPQAVQGVDPKPVGGEIVHDK